MRADTMKYRYFYYDLCFFVAMLTASVLLFFNIGAAGSGGCFFAILIYSIACKIVDKCHSKIINQKPELIVNESSINNGEIKYDVLQHLYIQVNSDEIRTEIHNGRQHYVIPSYTLPDNVVMNDGLYTREQIDKHYLKLNGTLAPLEHPKIDGEYVSAFKAEAIHTNHVGAFNRNVERRGNRIYSEKWVDIEYANQSENGRLLINAIKEKKPIHTSIAVYAHRRLTPNAVGYKWVAEIFDVDHDAILLKSPGAATPEGGVGLFVNVAQAKPMLEVNAGVLSSDSYGARMKLLSDSAAETFKSEQDWRSWVEDFDAVHAIVHIGLETMVYSYAIVDGAVRWGSDGKEVVSKQTWLEKVEQIPLVNSILQRFKINVNSSGDLTGLSPKKTLENKPMPMTPEEKAEFKAMLDAQAAAIQANTAEQIKPLAEKVAALETNNAEILLRVNESKDKEEADMRTVVKEHLGEVVANALKGEALTEAFKKLRPDSESAVPGLNANSSSDSMKAPTGDELKAHFKTA